ncbi:MAG: MG2 domain-containing protein, partial [Treponema sp.]|nr:MG2 domain-containing protein [Treponema sp.]
MRKAILAVFCAGLAALVLGACAGRVDGGGATTAFAGAHVEAGRPAQGLSHMLIQYFEPAPGAGDAESAPGAIAESDEPFEILDFGPREVLPHEIRHPSIYVAFSQPAIPLARLGEAMREDAGFFAIDPPLSGVYRWYGTRLLSFEPDAAVIPQQRYTITVSDKITSLGGKPLTGSRAFSFETARLTVLDWQLGPENFWVWRQNAHPEDARHIRLLFSHPVNLNEIANWIEVRAAGRSWPFTLSYLSEEDMPWFGWGADRRRVLPGQRVLLTVNEPLPLNTQVTMELREGARSEPGWLGSLRAESWSFHTLVPFAFEGASARAFTQPRMRDPATVPISLRFNQNVEPSGLERHISVDGFPPLTAANFSVFGNTVEIRGLPLRHETSYFVHISSDVADIFGRRLGQDRTQRVDVGEANPFVYISNTGARMLEAGFPAHIVWEAQNPISIRRLTRTAGDPYAPIPLASLLQMDVSELQANAKNYFVEDLSPFLNSGGFGSVAMRWEHQLRDTWGARQIRTNNFWLNVQVTNIGITMRYGYNRVLVWATRLSDGSPIANAEVELMEGTQVLMTGRTNAQGLAVFEFAPGEFAELFDAPNVNQWQAEFGSGFRLRVSHGSGDSMDSAEFIPNQSHNLWRFSVPSTVSPFMAERERPAILMFTDRGLYRAGETVTFRSIDRSLTHGAFSAFQGAFEIEVSSDSFQAPVIATLSGNTTASGGAYGSFDLPENLLPGRYR